MTFELKLSDGRDKMSGKKRQNTKRVRITTCRWKVDEEMKVLKYIHEAKERGFEFEASYFIYWLRLCL